MFYKEIIFHTGAISIQDSSSNIKHALRMSLYVPCRQIPCMNQKFYFGAGLHWILNTIIIINLHEFGYNNAVVFAIVTFIYFI